MNFLRSFWTFLLVKQLVSCKQLTVSKNISNAAFRELIPTSVSQIKKHCETQLSKNVSDFSSLYNVTTYNSNCNKTMDAKSCCYCSTYFDNFRVRENFYPNLESFYWARIDLSCPLAYPFSSNINYYKLKKKLFKRSGSKYDENYIRKLCSHMKFKNKTFNNLTQTQMFCGLYGYYEHKTSHVYHVKSFVMLFDLEFPNVSFEAENVFEQNSWTAFFSKR